MFLGVMSRDVEVSRGQNFLRSLVFVTLAYASEDHRSLILRLTFEITHVDRDEVIKRGPYTKPLSEDLDLDDQPKLVIIKMPMDDINLSVDSSIKARLEYGDVAEEYLLNVIPFEEGIIE
ncbi:hypothetical protein VCJ71_08215 [Alteriqipengyuania sp. WL0013]|uniref:hypothetical protein n=1 Tax=Alteriqipengyuania sp. WL0013 TaxID=3110773 RepID=UPI002C337831|nr:hypothetical protein [Alteriqipengyuania sp. WL0013]MEB3416046.1 hypothetical protein [Alteriqipengyuania sp. WL0013]